VTLPHGTPDPRAVVRSSDRVAPAATAALLAALARAGLPDEQLRVTLVAGTVVRAECDLNRYNECGVEFKRALAAALARAPALVLDMHSFPGWMTWGAAATPPDVALLYARDALGLPRRLAPVLERAGLATVVTPGAAGVNYIVEEATRRGLAAVLVEANEARPVEPLAEALAAFVVAEARGRGLV